MPAATVLSSKLISERLRPDENRAPSNEHGAKRGLDIIHTLTLLSFLKIVDYMQAMHI